MKYKCIYYACHIMVYLTYWHSKRKINIKRLRRLRYWIKRCETEFTKSL